MAVKEYRSPDALVTYDADVCIHAAECVRGLPRVFNPEARPWIQPGNAAPADLEAVIARCPSGALQYRPMSTTPAPTPAPAPASGVKVVVKPNGPLLVQGGACVTDIDGKVLKEGPMLALCRCGQSGTKPFCDGTHSRAGWKS